MYVIIVLCYIYICIYQTYIKVFYVCLIIVLCFIYIMIVLCFCPGKNNILYTLLYFYILHRVIPVPFVQLSLKLEPAAQRHELW